MVLSSKWQNRVFFQNKELFSTEILHARYDIFFHERYSLQNSILFLGLECNLSVDKEGLIYSFIYSNKFCWKAASYTIKYSSNPARTKYDYLAYLFKYYYDLILLVASNVS